MTDCIWLWPEMNSNGHMVAIRLGNVVKSGSVVRVVEASRWNVDAAFAVAGTPTLLNPLDPDADDAYVAVDESEQPHLELDADLIRHSEGEPHCRWTGRWTCRSSDFDFRPWQNHGSHFGAIWLH